MASKEINYWHQPIALIHDYLKGLPNDLDKAKESIKHGFVQVSKGDPLARLADEMEVSSKQSLKLIQGSGGLSAVLDLRICLIRSCFH